MKKVLFKLFVIVIFIQACIVTNVFAADSFRVKFQEELSVKAGETIEIPIIMDNIDFNGIQKGVIAFSCKLNYDNTVFELVEYDDNNTFKINEDIELYVQYNYTNESNKLVVQFSNSYFNEFGGKYVDSALEIGKIKIKAKEDILSGAYSLSITEVEGGNTDTIINVSDYESKLYVIGTEIIEQTKEDENNAIGQTVNGTQENKKIVVSITQNDEGTELYVKPDSEEGIEISKIVVENNEVTLKDGVYTAKVVPGGIYKIHLYDKNGGFIGTQIVKIAGEVVELINTGTPVVDDGSTDDETDKETGKDENKDTSDKNEETSKDTNNDKTDDTNKDNDTGRVEGVQTGDVVIIPVCIVMILVIVANLIIYWKRLESRAF